MRSFVITLILLVVVIAAVLATAPRLVDWNDYRGLLTRQAEAITGGAVAIEGRIDFSLLPTPTLTLAQTRLTGGDGAGGRTRLGIDRIDLRLRALPLLRGEVRIGDVRLVRPVLEIDRSPDQGAAPPDGSNSLLSLIANRPDHLTVVDGRAVLHDDRAAGWQLDAINAEMVAQSRDGPFALRGSFAAAAREFDLDAEIGRLSPDHVGTLQLTLAALGPQPASLRYNGAVWWHADNPRARGDVTLAGQNTGSVMAIVGDALGRALPQLPSWLDQPFEISGRLQLDRESLQLDELALLLAETAAEGQLSLAFGASPTMALGLQTERLELGDLPAARPADLAPLVALSRALRGEIDLSVAAVQYRERSADRVRLRLRLTGDGEVAVEQASAILPGQTDLRFAGRLAATGGPVDLRGKVDAVTDDLGALLAWLDIRPPAVASGRLRTLSISSALAFDGDAVQLSQTEVRVDATHLRGSAALEMNGSADDARPRFTADLVLDRLNIDAYQADLLPTDAADVLQRALRHADAEISMRVERLTWRGLLMRDVVVALRADQGPPAGEQRIARDGGRGGRPAGRRGRPRERRLRVVGRDPHDAGRTAAAPARPAGTADALARPAPDARGRGRRDGPGSSTSRSRSTMARGGLPPIGEAGWVDGRPRYDLEIELGHPDVNVLIRPLGATTTVGGDASPTALSFARQAYGCRRTEHTIAGSARLGHDEPYRPARLADRAAAAALRSPAQRCRAHSREF